MKNWCGLLVLAVTIAAQSLFAAKPLIPQYRYECVGESIAREQEIFRFTLHDKEPPWITDFQFQTGNRIISRPNALIDAQYTAEGNLLITVFSNSTYYFTYKIELSQGSLVEGHILFLDKNGEGFKSSRFECSVVEVPVSYHVSSLD